MIRSRHIRQSARSAVVHIRCHDLHIIPVFETRGILSVLAYQGTVAPIEVRGARHVHGVNAPALHNTIGRGIADDGLVPRLAAAVVGIVISHIEHSRGGRQAGLVGADDPRLTQTFGILCGTRVRFVVAHVNVKLIHRRGGHTRRGKLVAHHLAKLAAAGAQLAGAARRVHRHGSQQLHGGGVIDQGVRAVSTSGAAVLGGLVGAVRVHAGRVVVGVQPVHDGRNRGRIARRLFQRQNVQRLRRVAAHNLFADPFQHAAAGDAAAGRSNQSRKRSGIATGVGFNVVRDDAQGPGLGGSDRRNAAGQNEGQAARKEAVFVCVVHR